MKISQWVRKNFRTHRKNFYRVQKLRKHKEAARTPRCYANLYLEQNR